MQIAVSNSIWSEPSSLLNAYLEVTFQSYGTLSTAEPQSTHEADSGYASVKEANTSTAYHLTNPAT